MLVNVNLIENPINKINNLIAVINGNSIETINHEIGIYEIGHFSFNHMIKTKEEYPVLKNIQCYGVCDDYKQILKKEPMLQKSNRKFVISITPIEKNKQESNGGWRWHKWGPYIGKQKPTCEYLYDEPIIEKVYCYHIFEV